MKTKLTIEALGMARSKRCPHWWRHKHYFGLGADGYHIHLCDRCIEAEA
jgi:hypothetical protein